MNAEDLLVRIQIASKAEDLLTRNNYRKEYVNYVKLIHPDVCSLAGANDAVEKLNAFKEEMEQLNKIEDDAGLIQQIDDKTFLCKGEKEQLLRSLENYNRLMKLNDDSSRHFQKYLPTSMKLEGDYLRISYSHRMVSFSHLTLPQEHVSWIMSRMLEFTAWLHQIGYCHAGFNPEVFCVVPETHGIVCLSFYHVRPMKSKLNTVSGKYLDWYPQIVFDKKQAIAYVDVSLAQRTALYLLGDKSGNGVKLKKTCNEHLINFLIAPHYEAYQTYDDYRQLLRSIFGKPQYHELNI
ncbi:hypothetical protein [Xanthocytophaga agilis]|uniref:Protein kinase domain-containing protein n=1 Tax=Xanthocytophaga agilis TaxID=3048010 RepID=A0AAE3R4Z6_9BACT|nr:hypothetical protein [Xanthocytophaga agilis]MDJ1500782.1 hypothetical protein [Xanthocytophaga agilis]